LRHAQLVGAEIEKRLSRRQHAAAAIAEPALQPFADIAGPVVARGVAVADLEDRDPTAAATALVGLEHRVEIGERAAGGGAPLAARGPEARPRAAGPFAARGLAPVARFRLGNALLHLLLAVLVVEDTLFVGHPEDFRLPLRMAGRRGRASRQQRRGPK